MKIIALLIAILIGFCFACKDIFDAHKKSTPQAMLQLASPLNAPAQQTQAIAAL
ncbi:hypothetical protein [Pontibacter liquoris]|uniref:hypothetical protein n=1 Tax=Pontibacter liquoris TaxID=2905677 RepID=UPI001FA75467|nr:hypothetical protein [Pontibacter liquoris]